MAHPSTGKAEVNLEAAKMFIDHLEIIREKTRGNLSKDEEKILTSVLSELQLAYVQVSSGAPTPHVHDENCSHGDHAHEPTPEASVSTGSTPAEETKTVTSDDEEGKKRFTKSYGS
jgi:septal ring-binding cell division protein DamX